MILFNFMPSQERCQSVHGAWSLSQYHFGHDSKNVLFKSHKYSSRRFHSVPRALVRTPCSPTSPTENLSGLPTFGGVMVTLSDRWMVHWFAFRTNSPTRNRVVSWSRQLCSVTIAKYERERHTHLLTHSLTKGFCSYHTRKLTLHLKKSQRTGVLRVP